MPDRWWDWPEPCRIVRILDGDTCEAAFTASADAGFRVTLRGEVRQIVRFWGMNTDELRDRDPIKRASAKRATEALNVLMPPGTICSARTIEDRDARGRWLGVFTLADGRVVNDEMVRLGHARPYDGGAR